MHRNMDGEMAIWLKPELLPSLAEFNGQFIDLLILQAMTAATPLNPPMLEELRPLLLALDPEARQRAAACPFLLMDVGFSDAQRWLWACGYAVCDGQPTFRTALSSLPQGIALARQVFAYAWHLARSHRNEARIALGMSASTAEVLSNCTLAQTMGLAERHPHWLQPRWPRHIGMWGELLRGAARGEGIFLEQARLRGVQLLAAEARSSALP